MRNKQETLQWECTVRLTVWKSNTHDRGLCTKSLRRLNSSLNCKHMQESSITSPHPESPLFFFPPTEMHNGRRGRGEDVREGGMISSPSGRPHPAPPFIVVRRIAGWQAQFNERNTKLKWWRVLLLPYSLSFRCVAKNDKFPCLCFSNMTHLGSFGIVVVIWIKMRICWEKKPPSPWVCWMFIAVFFFFFAVSLNGCSAQSWRSRRKHAEECYH